MSLANSNFLEFSKPFIEAAKNVFETMVFTKLEPGKPQVKKGSMSKGDVSAVLGLSGTLTQNGKERSYRAMLVLSFPYDCYIKLASAMLMEEYTEFNEDIRDENAMGKLFSDYGNDIEVVIHAAAQPSHDWAAKEPFTDFSINANGTLVLLEKFKNYCPKASFIFMSTNKVYGDTPNALPMIETDTRW